MVRWDASDTELVELGVQDGALARLFRIIRRHQACQVILCDFLTNIQKLVLSTRLPDRPLVVILLLLSSSSSSSLIIDTTRTYCLIRLLITLRTRLMHDGVEEKLFLMDIYIEAHIEFLNCMLIGVL